MPGWGRNDVPRVLPGPVAEAGVFLPFLPPPPAPSWFNPILCLSGSGSLELLFLAPSRSPKALMRNEGMEEGRKEGGKKEGREKGTDGGGKGWR
jgi:hypothetical protein